MRGNESNPLTSQQRAITKKKIENHVKAIYDALGIDTAKDPNSKDSPARISRMLVDEILEGCFTPAPRLTFFKNTHKYDQLISRGPIPVNSTCAHHWMPIVGQAYVSILPSKEGKIIGLSKFDRIVEWYARRFQTQEELTCQIADHLEKFLKPAGLGVRIISTHFCTAHRGVRNRGVMDTTIVRGDIRNSASLKAEFMDSCKAMREHPSF